MSVWGMLALSAVDTGNTRIFLLILLLVAVVLLIVGGITAVASLVKLRRQHAANMESERT